MKSECEFKITWAKESIFKSYAIGNTKPNEQLVILYKKTRYSKLKLKWILSWTEP